MALHLHQLLAFVDLPPSPTVPDILGVFFFFIVVAILWNIVASAGRKKKLEQARRDAHNFTAPNIHGGPREASEKDLKSKGWIK